MASIKICTIDSNYDLEALKSLANNLVTNLKLDNLSVQTIDGRAFLMSNEKSESLNGELKKAILYYLKQNDYVIFLTDELINVR